MREYSKNSLLFSSLYCKGKKHNPRLVMFPLIPSHSWKLEYVLFFLWAIIGVQKNNQYNWSSCQDSHTLHYMLSWCSVIINLFLHSLISTFIIFQLDLVLSYCIATSNKINCLYSTYWHIHWKSWSESQHLTFDKLQIIIIFEA